MKNIVVLDNNHNIRQRIKTIMASIGVNVIEVSSSSQLLSEIGKVESVPYLIILELNLVTENGFSAIKKLKNKNLDIPIIILTSENKRSSFIRGVQEEAIDYILKPFNDDELKARIIKHIEFKPKKENNMSKELSLNFQQYLQSELKKSEKRKKK